MFIPGLSPTINDPRELAHHVLNEKEGRTDPESARRVLNHLFYENIAIVNRETGETGLRALPVDTKLNLYESIANERHANNAPYLAALNQELGLTADFYRKQSEAVKTYFAFENTRNLEARWQYEYGEGSFARTMNRMVNNEPDLNEAEKKQAAEFMIRSYAEHRGIAVPKVVFFEGPEELQGYRDPRQDVIGINVKSSSFLRNPADLIFTAFHEVDHGNQMDLGKRYLKGEMKPGDENYVAGRVFAANLLSLSGYLSPAIAGMQAYEFQPAEISSNVTGTWALDMAREIYGGQRKEPVRRPGQPSPRYADAPVYAS